MKFMDVAIAGAMVFMSQGGPENIGSWFTADKFAMGVAVYLLIRMEKTMKDLTEAISTHMPKRGKK